MERDRYHSHTFLDIKEMLKVIEEIRNDSQEHLQLTKKVLQNALEKDVGEFAVLYLSDKNAAIDALTHISNKHRLAALIAISGVWRPDSSSIPMILSIMKNETDETLRCFAITMMGNYYQGSHDSTIERQLQSIIESADSSSPAKASALAAHDLVSGKCSILDRAKKLGLKIGSDEESFLNDIGKWSKK